ncbi:hypothetical protein KJS94_11160 [Flavihumibacter rivuli]|uniref:hypothetical protein n=1 Tax=Flavihumibacter rivuli TaxID=2838156 RepID=UPI001BDE3568|nr:hypothetical protein [Flavihumibacter rivuli]ULQ55200.1 hypothetical protein KJS94_11160 [Flavihumibacter rivuli]
MMHQGIRFGRKVIVAGVLSLLLQVLSLHFAKAQSGIPQEGGSPSGFYTVAGQVLDLFKNRDIVAIDEGHHQSKVFHEFLQVLIAHRDFPRRVNDVVVEFGNARYQPVMDDYLAGKLVPDTLLAACWRETTQVLVWDNPVYAGFFKSIRDLNKGLPANRRIRVLLGDPPIDWTKVHTTQDWVSSSPRDRFPYDLIVNHVLQRKRKALVIYGGFHLYRKDIMYNFQAVDSSKEKLGVLLARRIPVNYAVVWTRINEKDSLVNKVFNGAQPQCMLTRTPAIDTIPFSRLLDFQVPRFYEKDGKRLPLESGKYVEAPVGQVVDALLWLAPLDRLTQTDTPSPEWFGGRAYTLELVRRCKILHHPDLPRFLELMQVDAAGEQ